MQEHWTNAEILLEGFLRLFYRFIFAFVFMLFYTVPTYGEGVLKDKEQFLDSTDWHIIEVGASRLHEQLRVNHGCFEDEDTNSCLMRSCSLDENFDAAELAEKIWFLNPASDEDLNCIFRDTGAADYVKKIREIFANTNDLSSFFESWVKLSEHPFVKSFDDLFLQNSHKNQREDPVENLDSMIADLIEENSSLISAPKLTISEIKNFKNSIEKCWILPANDKAAQVSLTIAVSLDKRGRIEVDSLRLLEASEAPSKFVKEAFRSVKRAVLRCGVNGYNLPANKYPHWKNLELVFKP